MRYISLIIGCVLALASCNEVKVSGNGDGAGVLTAGFRDTVVTVFENVGTGSLHVDFSQALTQDTKVVLTVAGEENMQENKDFFIPAKEFVVAAGEKSMELHYSLTDDNVANDSRSFTLRLTSVNGGVIDALTSQVKVKVLDDESDVAVGFEDVEVTVWERESGSDVASYVCQIPVKVFGNMRKPLQFVVAVHALDNPNNAVEGEHFRLLESVFVVEDASAVITVPVEIIDDELVNANRVFALDINQVVGGEIYTDQKRCVVTIENDDMGIYFGEAKVEAEERAGKVKIPVKLTRAGDQDMNFTLSVAGTAEEEVDYSLTKEWTIEAGKDEMEIEIDLKHVEGVQPDRVLTLGFASVGTGLAVFEEQATCNLNILDVDTKVDFKYSEWGVKDMRGTVQVPIVLAEPLTHDVTLGLNLNLVDGADATVAVPTVTIAAGQTSAVIEVNVARLSAKSFTMNIVNVAGATAVDRLAKIAQLGEIQTPQELTIAEFSSQAENEAAPNGFATAAVDGDPNTFWHSRWASPSAVLPQYIVVQVPDIMHVGGVDVVRRIAASNSDNKVAEIWLSEDMENWELQGTLEWDAAKSTDLSEHLRHLDFNHMQKGGYIKINVTEGYRNNAQVGEVIVYGYTE